MKKSVFAICLILCMLVTGAIYAQNETESTSTIPNYTVQEPEDNNGRSVHLDQDKESAEDLNAAERRVILEDAIQSNKELIDQRN
jgi:hypothetical protein